MHRLLVIGLLVLTSGFGGPGPRSAASARTPITATPVTTGQVVAVPVDYAVPSRVPLRVVRAFVAPVGPYGPGHRGVDLDLTTDSTVLSAAEGTVAFAGQVAGRGVVVLVHADGVRTEYEPVTPAVTVGAAVPRGRVIGHVSGRHPGCPLGLCLHWGARIGAQYLDPLMLLGASHRPLGPVRLLPWR